MKHGIFNLYTWAGLWATFSVVLLACFSVGWQANPHDQIWELRASVLTNYPARATNWFQGTQYGVNPGSVPSNGLSFGGAPSPRSRITQRNDALISSYGHISHWYSLTNRNTNMVFVDPYTNSHSHPVPYQNGSVPRLDYPDFEFTDGATNVYCRLYVFLDEVARDLWDLHYAGTADRYQMQSSIYLFAHNKFTNSAIKMYETLFGNYEVHPTVGEMWQMASNWNRWFPIDLYVWTLGTNTYEMGHLRMRINLYGFRQWTNPPPLGRVTNFNDYFYLYPSVGQIGFFSAMNPRKGDGLPWFQYVIPYENPATNSGGGD